MKKKAYIILLLLEEYLHGFKMQQIIGRLLVPLGELILEKVFETFLVFAFQVVADNKTGKKTQHSLFCRFRDRNVDFSLKFQYRFTCWPPNDTLSPNCSVFDTNWYFIFKNCSLPPITVCMKVGCNWKKSFVPNIQSYRFSLVFSNCQPYTHEHRLYGHRGKHGLLVTRKLKSFAHNGTHAWSQVLSLSLRKGNLSHSQRRCLAELGFEKLLSAALMFSFSHLEWMTCWGRGSQIYV